MNNTIYVPLPIPLHSIIEKLYVWKIFHRCMAERLDYVNNKCIYKSRVREREEVKYFNNVNSFASEKFHS